jgi:cytoskeletal protein RodZ
MRYEKKILEEEVKLFKQQKAAKNTQRPFFKLALIAGIIIGCLAILAIMVFKQKSKSSSDLVNQSKAVTNDTVKQSANKMPEAGNDTDYKPAAQANAPVLPTIRQDTIPTNKTGPIDSASSKIAMVQPFAPNKVAANNNVATAPLPPASTSNTAGSNFKSPKNNPKYKNAEKHQKKATVVFKSIY